MAKMRIMVIKYGYAVVEADTTEECIKKAESMPDSDFD